MMCFTSRLGQNLREAKPLFLVDPVLLTHPGFNRMEYRWPFDRTETIPRPTLDRTALHDPLLLQIGCTDPQLRIVRRFTGCGTAEAESSSAALWRACSEQSSF